MKRRYNPLETSLDNTPTSCKVFGVGMGRNDKAIWTITTSRMGRGECPHLPPRVEGNGIKLVYLGQRKTKRDRSGRALLAAAAGLYDQEMISQTSRFPGQKAAPGLCTEAGGDTAQGGAQPAREPQGVCSSPQGRGKEEKEGGKVEVMLRAKGQILFCRDRVHWIWHHLPEAYTPRKYQCLKKQQHLD
ncbi:hypothetical protein AAES_55516 [Amazona aestiva]|uniref:Uncharacterized protein n=1 Tax=Amazona aestiva TaxID=12930 RepID=A0A0Q3MMH1_AMAAE|nr:hypothetical protein AAES_55516 [Amazona aestiva]